MLQGKCLATPTPENFRLLAGRRCLRQVLVYLGDERGGLELFKNPARRGERFGRFLASAEPEKAAAGLCAIVGKESWASGVTHASRPRRAQDRHFGIQPALSAAR